MGDINDIEAINQLNIDDNLKEKFKTLIDEEIFSVDEIINDIYPTLINQESRISCILISRLLKRLSEADPSSYEHPSEIWQIVLSQPVESDAVEEKIEIIPPPSTSVNHTNNPPFPSSSSTTNQEDRDNKSRKSSSTSRHGVKRYTKYNLNERVQKLADELNWEFVVSKLQRRLGPSKQINNADNQCSENEQYVDEANMNEVFLGRLSPDVYEDEIYDLVADKVGAESIVLIRVMTSREGVSRGYAFVRLQDKETCFKVIRELNDYSIRPRYQMKVNYSPPNVRLHVSNIPKNKDKDELKIEFEKITDGMKDLHIHQGIDKNRGFCFIDFLGHQLAKAALRKFNQKETKIFGRNVVAEWAEPFEEVDPEIMAKVKTLYVKNIDPEVTEARLQEVFDSYGKVESIRKNVDYAFVHYYEREDAMNALESLNQQAIGRHVVDIALARPHEATKRDTMNRRRTKRSGGRSRDRMEDRHSLSSSSSAAAVASASSSSSLSAYYPPRANQSYCGGGDDGYYDDDYSEHNVSFRSQNEPLSYLERSYNLHSPTRPAPAAAISARRMPPSNVNFYEDTDESWYGGGDYYSSSATPALARAFGNSPGPLKRPGVSMMSGGGSGGGGSGGKRARGSLEGGRQ